MAKKVKTEGAAARLKVPAGAENVSVGEHVYKADEDGFIEVPADQADDIGQLMDHGCKSE